MDLPNWLHLTQLGTMGKPIPQLCAVSSGEISPYFRFLSSESRCSLYLQQERCSAPSPWTLSIHAVVICSWMLCAKQVSFVTNSQYYIDHLLGAQGHAPRVGHIAANLRRTTEVAIATVHESMSDRSDAILTTSSSREHRTARH